MSIDVWDEMMTIERRLDDLARGYLGPRARASYPSLASGLHKPFVPRADVFTTEAGCVILLEMAGIDPDKDIELFLGDGELIVRGKRVLRTEVPETDYFRMEVSYGSFERRFALADNVRPDDVRAEYRDGMLEVTISTPHPDLPAKEDWRAVPISSGKDKS